MTAWPPPNAPGAPSTNSLDRRSFLKTVAVASLGATMLSPPVIAAAAAPSAAKNGAARRRRYAIVGVGVRHQMFQDAIEKDYASSSELVGLCDTNPGRLEAARQRSIKNGAPPPPAFRAEDFARMIAETKPEIVIVTTVDATHHQYIVRAMEAGCDVITEKPMTTTAEACEQIFETRRRTGKTCRVTHNYRYAPPRTQVKELLMSGEIGDILSVDFHWLLNTHHGADYFRRWHSRKKNSGGLMVHKSSHHFDLVNWWLGAMPVSVAAKGKREFYTPAMARRLGLRSHHERCHTCPEKNACSFFFSLADNPTLKELYLDQEKHDGYFRDQCVWRPEIDIEDTMNVVVSYDTGATLSYSLNAFNAWEGYTIAFNGTKGRLEHAIVERIYVNGTDTVQGGIQPGGVTTRVIPLRGEARDITPWEGDGGHAGGDSVMLDEIFLPVYPPDKYKRIADERAGAASCLVGIAANRSFETGGTVNIADLAPHLSRPELAPMPGRNDPVPMPPRLAAASVWDSVAPSRAV